MPILEVCKDSELENAEQTEERPWFSIFNQYYGPERTVMYMFQPFPTAEFPPLSPWEDCIIFAHFGIERYAAADGFGSVDKYLKHLIRKAATRTM